MAKKKRCVQCKEYLPEESFYRTGLGLGAGVCSEECFDEWKQKYRDKRTRRANNRTRRYGRRLPGTCRERVRNRDEHKCRWCGKTDDLNIHHVRYRSEGGPDNPKNLITLCFGCHKQVHTNKRLYQPALMLWLWLYYEQGFETTIARTLDWVKNDEKTEWVEQATRFSEAVRLASKPPKARRFKEA